MSSISAPFGSESDADAAYYGTDGDGGPDPDATWGDLQEGAALGSGWVLAYQEQQNGSRTRWFVIRMANGTLQALNSAGEVEEAGEQTTLSELPNYGNEDDARDAYAAWAEENGDEPAPDSGEWGEWTKVSETAPWHIYSRSHTEEDRAQFLATSTLGDGSTVYLADGGEVVDEPHVFDSADALSSALEAFYQRAENGEIPEDRSPTGDDPGTETVRREASNVKSTSNTAERIIEKMGGSKVALAAVGVAAVAVYQSNKNGGS